VRLTNHLVNRRPARFGFPIGRLSRKGTGSTVVMGVDPFFIAAHLIHIPHDQQLVLQRFEWLQYIVEAFGLQRSGNSQTKEDVKRPHRNLWLRRGGQAGRNHLLQQR
jgi:hypothetical protein